jgi:hypothetical protein
MDGAWHQIHAAIREQHCIQVRRNSQPSARIIDRQSVKTTGVGESTARGLSFVNTMASAKWATIQIQIGIIRNPTGRSCNDSASLLHDEYVGGHVEGHWTQHANSICRSNPAAFCQDGLTIGPQQVPTRREMSDGQHHQSPGAHCCANPLLAHMLSEITSDESASARSCSWSTALASFEAVMGRG